MTVRQSLIQIAADAARDAAGKREALERFFLSRHNPDGGFRGKGPQSDLYYTGFAVPALLAMEIPFDREKTAGFLHSFGDGKDLDLPHLAVLARVSNLLIPDFTRRSVSGRLAAHLQKFRTSDGGYHHIAHQSGGSAYGCFLTLGICEDLEAPAADISPRMGSFLSTLRQPEGSYLNETAIPVVSVPSTAAALVTLEALGQKDHQRSIEWMLSNADDSGGFRVMRQAPVPDLLSTAVGLFALSVVGADVSPVRDKCRAFIESLWDEAVGFRPNPLDGWSDCEYTFYGLLALGALADG